MELIKKNIEKKREVYKLDDRYRKVWYIHDEFALEEHISILDKVIPGYVLELKTFKQLSLFTFCNETLDQTLPYAHYDWVLSNILLDGDNTYLVDWDNVGIYSPQEIQTKMESDLRSAFGEKYDEMLRTMAQYFGTF